MPRTTATILLVILSLLANACNFPTTRTTKSKTPLPPASSLIEAYSVDPTFQSFYDSLGGSGRLGPAISPLIESGNIKSQYLESSLMVYDPSAALSDRYRLEALGVMLGISEPPIQDPGRPGEIFVNGHVIFPDFVPFYIGIGGARIVGRPLTEARHNPEQQRIEQYFENLVLYRFVWDSPDTVMLLAYGAYACDRRCRTQSQANNMPRLQGSLPEPFASEASRLGLQTTGLTLSKPYRASDGKIEVIFENLVMTIEAAKETHETSGMTLRLWVPQVFYRGPAPAEAPQYRVVGQLWLPLVVQINSNEPSVAIIRAVEALWIPLVQHGLLPRQEHIRLRPIVELIGIERGSPVPKQDNPLMVFYPVEGNLGYHVPAFFDTFVKQIGGFEMTGRPIMEVQPLEEGKFRQCFTNICLNFNTQAAEDEKLTLEDIGSEYKKRFYPSKDTSPKSKVLDGLRMKVREIPPFDFLEEGPEIQVTLSQDNQPLAGRELTLALTLPDGSRQIYALTPTDELGQTSQLLPIIEAPFGFLVLYEVCYPDAPDPGLCLDDNYMIFKIK